MTAKTIQVCADEWKSLPWKKFQKVLFRLQHRIYKAAKKNDSNAVKRLQSLLLGSKGSKYLAVRQVTQLNTGRKTAGVDGISSFNPKERLLLVDELNQMKDWNHQKLRRVFIFKEDGKNKKKKRKKGFPPTEKEKRFLGIPTIRDRAMQCLVKYALEPVYEASASDGSFGFRPGHSTWDIQNRIFQNLKSNVKGYQKSILKLEIADCFDEIDHPAIMTRVLLPGVAKRFLRTALKAGILKERTQTFKGIPQGGVLSPLLCNITLHGVEDLHNEWAFRQWYQRGLRYADEMIFILKPGECPDHLLAKVKDFLHQRGLKVAEAKTQLVSSTQGFDFLGWHFKVKAKNHKFVCHPSKKNRQQMIHKVKNTMRNSRYPMKDRLKKVKVLYRGWWNYHQYSDMQQINLWSIRRWLYLYVRKNTKMTRKERTERLQSIFNGHVYRVNRYPAVRGTRSVYNGDFAFWSKGKSKLYKGPLATALKRQGYRCNSCKLRFMANDWIELHHKDGNHSNFWLANVEALHRCCHHYQLVHRKKLLLRKKRDGLGAV